MAPILDQLKMNLLRKNVASEIADRRGGGGASPPPACVIPPSSVESLQGLLPQFGFRI